MASANKELTKRPLTVCLVAPTPPPYGGIAHWTRMLLGFSKNQSEVRFNLVDTAPRWRPVHDTARWKVVLGGSLQLARDAARLLWSLTLRRPDLIHITTSGKLAGFRDLVVMWMAKAFAVPVAYHVRFGRVPEIARDQTSEWRRMYRAMNLARVVIPIDVATESALRQYAPQARVERIPNPINTACLPAVRTTRGEVRTVMFLGWTIPDKGIGELVAAWARLSPPGWRLVVVGPGDQAYQRELRDGCGSSVIEFRGELDYAAAMSELAAADVFALPSYTEGFPNVVLEAMALGKAIVATDVGAIPEMLSAGCGLMVPPRNVDLLVAALSRVIGDEEFRAALGAAARERVTREYAMEGIFPRYVGVWRSICGRSADEPEAQIAG